MLSQPKSAMHKQAANFFQRHCRHLKGIVYLNSAFEKADRVQEQKCTGSQCDKNEQLTLLSQCELAFAWRNKLTAL